MRTNSFGRNSGRGLGQWMSWGGASWWGQLISGSVVPNAWSGTSDYLGNTYMSGRPAGSTSGQVTVKRNIDGAVIWQKKVNTTSTAWNQGAPTNTAVATNRNGTYVAVRTFNFTSISTYVVDWDLILLYDGNGNLLWQRDLHNVSTVFNNNVVGQGIAVDDNGNVYVAGKITTVVSSTLYEYGLLVKYDSSGNLAWRKVIQSNVNNKFTFTDCKTDGNYVYAIGWGTDKHLFKFDSSGNLIWRTGFTGSSSGGLALAPQSPYNIYVGWSPTGLFKFDSSGNLIWAKSGYAIYPVVNDDEKIFTRGGCLDSSGNFLFRFAYYWGTDPGNTAFYGLGANTDNLFITMGPPYGARTMVAPTTTVGAGTATIGYGSNDGYSTLLYYETSTLGSVSTVTPTASSETFTFLSGSIAVSTATSYTVSDEGYTSTYVVMQ